MQENNLIYETKYVLDTDRQICPSGHNYYHAPTINVLSKNIENIYFFPYEIFHFLKSLYIAWASFV